MRGRSIRAGGIIAAGEGSRLRADGITVSKPLATVAGKPLIAHAIERFRAAGIERLAMIINEESPDIRQWLDAHEEGIDLVVKTTPSSFVSFQIVSRRLAGEAAVIATVDSIMTPGSFVRFVGRAGKFPADAVVLGLTGHVDDEKPLWASLDRRTGRIARLGERNSGLVTAGVYVLPAHRPAEPAKGFARLRDYLGWLVTSGHPVYGVDIGRVFDIDRAQDIAAAQRELSGEERRSKGA